MKRLLFLLSVVTALALPATALAKGPSDATITGPGLAKAITISGPESEGSPMMSFAEAAGFFPAAFGQTPVVTTSTRPKGNLGPKYSIDYVVPGPDGGNQKIHQDLYPYANPAAWTYMPAGQPIFDMKTHGGWFTDAQLKTILVAHGLPKAAPTASSTSSSSAGFFTTGKIGALLLVLFGIGAAAVLTRRHLRGTAT
jgi:hypothetical protein